MHTQIAVNGACGRMGQRIIQLAHEDRSLALAAALEAESHPHFGGDIGELSGLGRTGVKVTSTLPLEPRPDVVIDFSTPDGTAAVLATCAQRQIPLLVATTGHTAAQRQDIESAAHDTAILMASNTSLVVNVLMRLLEQTARLLRDKDFDVEILERHHRFKKDSPSGTAFTLAHIVQKEMGHQRIRHGREGLVGERPIDEIGIHAIRTGDNVGEHTVIFSTLGETLELTQRAHTRDAYARGALQAARFLVGKPAGWYSMGDVLEV